MSDHRPVRPLVRALRWAGFAVLFGLCGAGWWAWHHGEAWLEGRVRERITQVIDGACVPGYSFTMHHLQVDVRTGRIQVADLELGFAPQLLDSLRDGRFRYLFAARAGRIELRGLSFWRLLLRREFRVDAFELLEPEITYLIGGERVTLADPFARLDPGGGATIALVRADTLLVQHASAIVEDVRGDLPELQLADLTVEARNVRIDKGGMRSGVRLQVDGTALSFENLQTQLPNGGRLLVGHADVDHDGHGLVEGIRLIPDGTDGRDTLRQRAPVIDLEMDSIVLHGIDLDRLIAHQELRIAHMELRGTRMEVLLDKTLPAGDPVRRSLPTTALRELPFTVRVDTLTVRRASGVYRERDGDTRQWGVVPFDRAEGRFTHITNHGPAITTGSGIEGGFSLFLFDSAHVAGRYTAELDGSDRFSLMAAVTGLALTHLNSATRPLLRVQVLGGMLHRLDLRMEGDDRRARGDLSLRFTDLLVRVEPGTPRELRHSMMGNMVETMLGDAYGGGLSADRERNYAIDRVPERGLVTYIWHATREGLARNLAPVAWDRMRSMLRTDGEQRRGKRAVRKAKRREGR